MGKSIIPHLISYLPWKQKPKKRQCAEKVPQHSFNENNVLTFSAYIALKFSVIIFSDCLFFSFPLSQNASRFIFKRLEFGQLA